MEPFPWSAAQVVDMELAKMVALVSISVALSYGWGLQPHCGPPREVTQSSMGKRDVAAFGTLQRGHGRAGRPFSSTKYSGCVMGEHTFPSPMPVQTDCNRGGHHWS